MLFFLGCMSPGFYGENCSIPCPQNCLDSRCHIVEGTCFGCVDGYIGDKCIENKGPCTALQLYITLDL